MGKLPVVWFVGRSLLVIVRVPPDLTIETWALGHETEPSTSALVVESQVPSSWIQGPAT